jgi:hypothetical protein
MDKQVKFSGKAGNTGFPWKILEMEFLQWTWAGSLKSGP